MITGADFAHQAETGGYLGIPYEKLDCQGFVERVLKDCGVRKPNGTIYDWRGSNSMYRNYIDWRGSIAEAEKTFGSIPLGALLFTVANDGGEKEKGYHDNLGNAKHVGIYIGGTHGSIHSTTGGVQYAKFPSKRWTHVGLLKMIDYHVQNEDNISSRDRIFSLLDEIKELISSI